jgi:transcriptional regulator with XRE-family HTH domain
MTMAKALSSHRLGNLRAIRERRVLSQVELAEISDVSRATVNALEAGKASAQPRTIRKLAKALGVDPLDLIGEPMTQGELPAGV